MHILKLLTLISVILAALVLPATGNGGIVFADGPHVYTAPGDRVSYQTGEGPRRFTLPGELATSHDEILIIDAAHVAIRDRELADGMELVFVILCGGTPTNDITLVEGQADVPVRGNEQNRINQRLKVARDHAGKVGRHLVELDYRGNCAPSNQPPGHCSCQCDCDCKRH